jgi:hypothetical protein
MNLIPLSTLLGVSVPRLNHDDFEFLKTQPKITNGVITLKCIRKRDKKACCAKVIPFAEKYQGLLSFLQALKGPRSSHFLKCFGYTSQIKEGTNTEVPMLIFEDYQFTLTEYLAKQNLNKQEYQRLSATLADVISRLKKDLPRVFPCITPDSIGIQIIDNKIQFKIIEMYIYDKAPAIQNAEINKWVAPEIFNILNFEQGKYHNPFEADNNIKSLLFSVGLVLLFAADRTIITEERKKVTKKDEFETIQAVEILNINLAIQRIIKNYGFTSEDSFGSFLEGALEYDLVSRTNLNKLSDILEDEKSELYIELQDISCIEHDENKELDDSSMLHLVTLKSGSHGPNELDANEYTLLTNGEAFKTYRHNENQRQYSGIQLLIDNITIPVNENPIVKEFIRERNFKYDGILKFHGYFHDPSNRRLITLIFDYHNETLEEKLSKVGPFPSSLLFTLARDLVTTLNFLKKNKDFSVYYITPRNIVYVGETDSNKKFKLVGLNEGLTGPLPDWVWVSPESYEYFRYKSGSNIDSEKALSYSISLIILYAALNEKPVQFRTNITGLAGYKNQEASVIDVKLSSFRNILGSQVYQQDTIENILDAVMTKALNIEPTARISLTEWENELRKRPMDFNVLDISFDSSPLKQLTRPQKETECERKVNKFLNKYCRGANEICQEWFKKFWCLYGLCCGLLFSAVIILIAFAAG